MCIRDSFYTIVYTHRQPTACRLRSGREAPVTEHEPELYWDSTYAIVVALMEHYPQRRPEAVGLEELAALVEALPGFQDDPCLLYTSRCV